MSDVKIKANEVIVKKTGNRRRTRKRGDGKTAAPDTVLESVLEQAEQHRSNPRRRGRGKRNRNTKGIVDNIGNNNPISEFNPLSQAFIMNYLAPGAFENQCGSAQVPDGALPVSVGMQFRFLDTMSFPIVPRDEDNINVTNVPTYSMLVIQFPLFRSLGVVVLNTTDGELTNAELKAFLDSFNSTQRETASFPKWVATSKRNIYWTSIATEAMNQIKPPDENGNSGLLNSFRFTSQYISVYYNTPDLINQGTYSLITWPTNHSTRSEVPELAVPGTVVEYLVTEWRVNFMPSVNIFFNQLGNSTFPEFSVSTINAFPSPVFVSTSAFRNAVGSFVVEVGDSLQYTYNDPNIRLVNVTKSTFIVLFALPAQSNVGGTSTTRFYRTSVIEEDDEDKILPLVNSDYTMITLPPHSQSDMYQQNPKTVRNLSKLSGGAEVIGSIYQPIFNVQDANTYAKIMLSEKGIVLNRNDYGPAGWYDTVDLNFCTEVINLQNIPYSAKLMISACRTVEAVPASESILGTVVIAAPEPCPLVTQTCQMFSHYASPGVGIANMVRYGLDFLHAVVGPKRGKHATNEEFVKEKILETLSRNEALRDIGRGIFKPVQHVAGLRK